MSKKMNTRQIEDWASEYAEYIKRNFLISTAGVYLAVMDMGEHYDVDVELDEGTIGATFINAGNLSKARETANIIEQVFKSQEIKVAKDRTEWEDALQEEIVNKETAKMEN